MNPPRLPTTSLNWKLPPQLKSDKFRAGYSIPPQIWYEICDSLNYVDLIRLAATCKAFRALTQLPNFNCACFRDVPIENTLFTNFPITVHPILCGVIDLVVTSLDEMIIRKYDSTNSIETHQIKPYFLPVSSEHATSPAVTQLRIKMGKTAVVSSKTGVTVKQVLIAVAKAWAATPTTGDKTVTYIDRLGDHCFFEGWDQAYVNAKGGTTLVPFYGS